MNIYSLVIETTRRCNLACPHCLRGSKQDISMKPEYIKKLLSQIECISNITFSGGEPTLPSGMKAIDEFISCIPNVSNFYIATNGMKCRAKFPALMNRLWNLCNDNDISAIGISYDDYHFVKDRQRDYFKYWLEEEMLYKYGIKLPIHQKKVYSILRERKAENWRNRADITSRVTKEEIIWNHGYDNDKDKLVVREGSLYLNCKGEIIAGCDWSYKNQSKHKICNINDDIKTAIMKNCTYDKDY